MPDVDTLTPDLENEEQPLPENEEEPSEAEEAEDSGQEEETPEPDDIAQLKSEVERLRGLEGLAADLRRSVGRIQALETRLQQESSNRGQVIEEINKQFGSVHELLSTVVDNIDETALDAATKARVRQAYEASRRAAENASLRNDAKKEVLDTLRQQYPQLFQSQQQQGGLSSEVLQQARQIEAAVEVMFEDRNLNPDDPQFKSLWNEGANLIQQGKTPQEVRAFFREKLNDISSEENATSRRQAVKNQAGRGSPKPSGAPLDFDARLRKSADSDNIDEGVKLLRELGLNV